MTHFGCRIGFSDHFNGEHSMTIPIHFNFSWHFIVIYRRFFYLKRSDFWLFHGISINKNKYNGSHLGRRAGLSERSLEWHHPKNILCSQMWFKFTSYVASGAHQHPLEWKKKSCHVLSLICPICFFFQNLFPPFGRLTITWHE